MAQKESPTRLFEIVCGVVILFGVAWMVNTTFRYGRDRNACAKLNGESVPGYYKNICVKNGLIVNPDTGAPLGRGD